MTGSFLTEIIMPVVPRDSITLGIEVGIQNAAMAILIAVSFLDRADFAVTAGVYGITMYLGAGFLVVIAKHFRTPGINSLPQTNSEK